MVDVSSLKNIIIKQNLSIELLSEKIGIDKSTFYRKLKENGKKFTIEEVIKMSQVLKLNSKQVDEIFFNN